MTSRPELSVLERQREAYELSVRSFKGGYGPTLSASASAAEVGTSIQSLGPAWSAGVFLAWPFFQGGLTHAQVREARANVDLSIARANLLAAFGRP